MERIWTTQKGPRLETKKRRLENYLDWNGYKRWFSYRQEKEVRKEVKVVGA